jgi:hypothetical protein
MPIVIFFLVGTVCPFAIWIGIYIATERDILAPHSMFRVIRAWRWISYVAAALLWACWLVFHLKSRWLWLYGASISTFSIGLSFPERWLKARISSSDLTFTPNHQV